MNKFFNMLHYLWTAFSTVVTGVTCVTTVFILIFWGTDIDLGVEILWQILMVSAICALGSLILYNEKTEFSKKQMLIRFWILFAFVNVVVLASGYHFQWFSFSNWKMVAGMELCIIVVFASTIIIYSLAAQKEADTMNKKLRERAK